MSNKPSWLLKAESYIGLKEIAGPKNNATVVNFWKKIHLNSISNDEVPWCAAFVGAVLEENGFTSSRSGLAKSYLNWGTPLKTPMLGCIVVFTRKGGGHVGFIEGFDKNGNIFVLGGNQSDAVNIKLFKTNNVVGYRWPSSTKEPQIKAPILATIADFEKKVT